MTVTSACPTSRLQPLRPGVAATAGVPLRSELEIATQQVRAIERFNTARRAVEQAEAAAARSRELRMDSARRLEVLRRQHGALVDRAQQQLLGSGTLVRTLRRRTVLLAHRNAWFLDRVGAVLLERGLDVVGRLDNGADVIGQAVVEQPDLLLVEDALAMVPGAEVVREVVHYCPSTRVVAQVAYVDRVGALLDAGAAAVFTRRIPPAEVGTALCDLVAA